MILGVCGFGATGSSAVADYLKEFATTDVLDNFEFQIITYPDGIESLDYFLNTNISKYATSDAALIRFKCYAERIARTYDKYTNGLFTALTKQYLSDITQATWRGYCGTDLSIFNSWTYLNIGNRLMKSRIIPLYERLTGKTANFYPVRDVYFSIRPENFDTKTKAYISDIIKAMGGYEKPITVLNQPFAGNDPVKSFKYFDKPKAIVVDRDPRDLYLFTKKFLKGVNRSIPANNVETFVTYYRNLRENMPYKDSNVDVLNISFESMIYDYDTTTSKIRSFCGLNIEDRNREIFIPSRSANNTKMFEKYKGFERDVEYISSELPQYIFDYSKYDEVTPVGGMFYGRSELNDGSK